MVATKAVKRAGVAGAPSPARIAEAAERAVKAEGGASLLLVDLDNLMVLNQDGAASSGMRRSRRR